MPVYGNLLTCYKCQAPVLAALHGTHLASCRTYQTAGSTRCECGAMYEKSEKRSHRATTDCRRERRVIEMTKKRQSTIPHSIGRELAARFPKKIVYDRLLGLYIAPQWVATLYAAARHKNYQERLRPDGDSAAGDVVSAALAAGGPTAQQKAILLEFRLRVQRGGEAPS